MIISISGKIGSGKDTVGKIIQYLTFHSLGINYTLDQILEMKNTNNIDNNFIPTWQIVKFADALKDIVCILTGCTREQLEDSKFKNSLLSECWNNPSDSNTTATKLINYSITYRALLQGIGTDLLRNQLHENVWVNALFSKYKAIGTDENGFITSETKGKGLDGDIIHIKWKPLPLWEKSMFPNWVITDCRFPNEADAVKIRGGINIRINRDAYYRRRYHWKDNDGNNIISKEQSEILAREEPTSLLKEHPSETALDDYKFDYYIDNNDSIERLVDLVKVILINEKII